MARDILNKSHVVRLRNHNFKQVLFNAILNISMTNFDVELYYLI